MLFWFGGRFEELITFHVRLIRPFDVKAKTGGGRKRQQQKKESKSATVHEEIKSYCHDMSHGGNKCVLCYELISTFGFESLIKHV